MPDRTVIFRKGTYTHRQMAALKRDLLKHELVVGLMLFSTSGESEAAIRISEKSVCSPSPSPFSFRGKGKTEFLALSDAAEKFEEFLANKKLKGETE